MPIKKSQKSMRSDKAKNTAKVLKEVINNPLQSVREIEAKTGVSKSSVQRIQKEELGQIGTKDQNILEICEVDFEIVKKGQAIINERLGKKQEVKKMRTFEIAQTIEKSEKRYMLFKGEATAKDGSLKVNGYDFLSDIQNGKITREQAYDIKKSIS